jgi:glycosyltransferase involved in cell wall biosynthesis
LENPGISIVIPAFNEEKFLTNTFTSIQIARDTFHREFHSPSEVIVVNNCSTDSTAIIATNLGARVIDHEKRNIASVRNAGIRAATYDLVVTIDADSIMPANALTEIWRTMLTESFIGGGVRIGVSGDRASLKALVFFADRLIVHGFGLSLGMFFFWKSAAESIHGFPEEFMVGEDGVFALLLRREARRQGLRFCNLNSVRLLTKDRKKPSVRESLRTMWHVFRQLVGRQVTKEELSFWYDPDR